MYLVKFSLKGTYLSTLQDQDTNKYKERLRLCSKEIRKDHASVFCYIVTLANLTLS